MRGRIAYLGMGRMGAAMVSTLRREGHEVVVWNRTESRARAVAEATGAEVAATAAQAAESAAFVLSSLADDAAVEDVYVGSQRVVESLGPGTVAMEMSTIAKMSCHCEISDPT